MSLRSLSGFSQSKKTGTKEVLAKLKFLKSIFGNPKRIITDRHGAFKSKELEKYCKDDFISHVTITTGEPKANGQIEKTNGIIEDILRKLSVDNPKKWYQHVGVVQLSINGAYQRSIDCSPFEVLFDAKMPKRRTTSRDDRRRAKRAV